MTPAKPIEPGCMALIIYLKCPEAGKIVQVGQKLNQVDFRTNMVDIWQIDQTITWISRSDDGRGPPVPTPLPFCPEQYLMRIDDPENRQRFLIERNLENMNPKVKKCPTQQPSVESSQ